MEKFPTWLVWAVSILLVFNVVALGLYASRDVEAVVDFTEQNDRLDSLELSVSGLSDTLSEPEEEEGEIAPGSFTLSKSEFEDEALEAEALRLATESVESRDFKKAAFFALVDNANVDIDSYKDITEVRILDVDVLELDEDETELEFSVKLYYFLDEDEDETERARLADFTVLFEDLDFDDDFEDAEVNESYMGGLVVSRVYD